MVLAAVLTVAENVLPLIIPYVPPTLQILLGIANGFVTVAAIAARFMAQNSMKQGQNNGQGS